MGCAARSLYDSYVDTLSKKHLCRIWVCLPLFSTLKCKFNKPRKIRPDTECILFASWPRQILPIKNNARIPRLLHEKLVGLYAHCVWLLGRYDHNNREMEFLRLA